MAEKLPQNATSFGIVLHHASVPANGVDFGREVVADVPRDANVTRIGGDLVDFYSVSQAGLGCLADTRQERFAAHEEAFPLLLLSAGEWLD